MTGSATEGVTGLALDSDDQAQLAEAVSHIEERVAILRDAEPYLIDMSAREATLSSYLGHTLEDKIALYEMARDLGFHDFGLSNFFAFPSVTDGFLAYLIEDFADEWLTKAMFYYRWGISENVDHASKMLPLWNLGVPDKFVEVFKNTAGIGLVRNYKALKK